MISRSVVRLVEGVVYAHESSKDLRLEQVVCWQCELNSAAVGL